MTKARFKPLLILPLLLALVLRSLVPVGYMPTPSGTGLMICDGVHHHPAPSHSPATHDDTCPFSALIFAATLHAAPPLPLPQIIAWLALTIALLSSPLSLRSIAYARPRAPPAR